MFSTCYTYNFYLPPTAAFSRKYFGNACPARPLLLTPSPT